MKQLHAEQLWSYSPVVIEKDYAGNGDRVYESEEMNLPGCPGDPSAFRSTYFTVFKKYRNGKPESEGSFYFNAMGDHDMDSTGTWKFYEGGKPVRTKQFHSWKSAYEADQHCLPDFEIPFAK
ncbi:MAG TPA: hypothetical protein VFU15_12410 [Bacteroidia bacterium]|nr:hypothetical protein [Bacteroidia bacterium]